MIYNSVILNFMWSLYQGLKRVYNESAAERLLNWFAKKVMQYSAQSRLLNVMGRKGFISRAWEYSAVYRASDYMMNAPWMACRKVCDKYGKVLSQSLFIRLLQSLVMHFEYLIAAALLIIAVIPHTTNIPFLYWNNLYGTAIVLLLTLLYIIKIMLGKSKGFAIGTMDFALVAFIVSVVVAQATSLFPGASLKFFIFYMTCFLLVLLIVSEIKTLASMETLLEGLLISVSLTGVYAVFQRIKGVPVDPTLTDLNMSGGMAGRVFSTMYNPNNYAELLILTLPFYLAAFLNAKTLEKKAVITLLGIPPLMALLMTGSRAGWGSFAVAFLVFVLLRNWKMVFLIIPLGMLGFLALPYIAPDINSRIMTIFNPNDTSIGYRGLIYSVVEPMFRDFWVTGMGLGAGDVNAPFMKILSSRYSLYLLKVSTTPPHTHNLFLQIWLEVGLAGIVTFVYFLVRLLKKSIVGIIYKFHTPEANILMAGVAALIGISMMGYVEHVWFYPRVMLFYWVIIAIILSALNILNPKEGESR